MADTIRQPERQADPPPVHPPQAGILDRSWSRERYAHKTKGHSGFVRKVVSAGVCFSNFPRSRRDGSILKKSHGPGCRSPLEGSAAALPTGLGIIATASGDLARIQAALFARPDPFARETAYAEKCPTLGLFCLTMGRHRLFSVTCWLCFAQIIVSRMPRSGIWGFPSGLGCWSCGNGW